MRCLSDHGEHQHGEHQYGTRQLIVAPRGQWMQVPLRVTRSRSPPGSPVGSRGRRTSGDLTCGSQFGHSIRFLPEDRRSGRLEAPGEYRTPITSLEGSGSNHENKFNALGLTINDFCRRIVGQDILERAAGIEPASLAWKAKVLPLHNARSACRGIFHRVLRVKRERGSVCPQVTTTRSQWSNWYALPVECLRRCDRAGRKAGKPNQKMSESKNCTQDTWLSDAQSTSKLAAQGSCSRARLSTLRPVRTSATICSRNSVGHGFLVPGIWIKAVGEKTAGIEPGSL